MDLKIAKGIFIIFTFLLIAMMVYFVYAAIQKSRNPDFCPAGLSSFCQKSQQEDVFISHKDSFFLSPENLQERIVSPTSEGEWEIDLNLPIKCKVEDFKFNDHYIFISFADPCRFIKIIDWLDGRIIGTITL